MLSQTAAFINHSEIVQVLCNQTLRTNDLLTQLRSQFPSTEWSLDGLRDAMLNGRRLGRYVNVGSEDTWGVNLRMLDANRTENQVYSNLCDRINPSLAAITATIEKLYPVVNALEGTAANITHDGSLTDIVNITGTGSGTISGFASISGDQLGGALNTGSQPHITSLGTLSELNMAGNISLNGHDILDAGTVSATSLSGALATAAQPAITSLGVQTSVTSSGTIQGAQIRSDDVAEDQILIGGASGRIISVGSTGTTGQPLVSAGPGNPPVFQDVTIVPSDGELFRRSLEVVADIYHQSVSSVTVTNLGVTTMGGGTKWAGGVLGTDGKVYGMPYSHTLILIIDPVAGTATATDFGVALTGNNKWRGGVLAPNGKIYGLPHDHSNILVIDPGVGSVVLTDMGTTLGTGTFKWYGGILGPDGKIYGISYSQTSGILIIDPIANSATVTNMGLALSSTFKFVGGVLAPNEKIYGVPNDYTAVLIIDPSTGTATTTQMGIPGASLSPIDKWRGGALGPDGRIYCIPYGRSTVLIIDPVTDTATLTTFGVNLGGLGFNFDGCVLGPDGKIYGMRSSAGGGLLIIDPILQTATLNHSVGSGTSKFLSGILAPNGKIYGIPYNHTTGILIISNQWAPPLTSDATLSAYLNKY